MREFIQLFSGTHLAHFCNTHQNNGALFTLYERTKPIIYGLYSNCLTFCFN